MKRMILLILCFCALFLILYIPLIPSYSITEQVFSEIRKPDMGTEKKPDCKECHSRSRIIKGRGKPAVQGQDVRKGNDKPTPPPDHIRKDKRKTKGLQ